MNKTSKVQAKMTIQEIAQESGVSVATVSRVLRNLPGVSEEMAAKVHQALEGREGFRPRIKQTRKLTRIALVAYKSEPNLDYFTAMALSGMSKFAFDYAIDVSLLIRPPELFDVPGLVGMLREHGADAAIISYSPDNETFMADLKAYRSQISIPLVTCYEPCDFLPSVVSNEREGEAILARHLIDLGHRKIGYLGASYGDALAGGCLWRLNVFRQACAEAGVVLEEGWTSVTFGKHLDLSIYYESAKDLLRRHPELTAIYCYNDDVALAASRACRDLGLRVPEDISLTGFDGAPYNRFSSPTITTFRVSADKMAYEASRLCYVMSKGIKQPAKSSVIPGELIPGESTGPCLR